MNDSTYRSKCNYSNQHCLIKNNAGDVISCVEAENGLMKLFSSCFNFEIVKNYYCFQIETSDQGVPVPDQCSRLYL